MIISLLFQQPLMFIVWALAIVYAITVHEFSHAYAAYILGDKTAASEGRLSFNPLAHLDVFGTIMLLIVGFGWGKPVPFNPYNLKNQRYGPAIISLAGPLSNIISFFIFGIILKILLLNHILGVDNLLTQFFVIVILINATLAIFNLLPIPPLDGSKLLYALLPVRYENLKFNIERYGPMVLITVVALDILFGISIFSGLINGILLLINKLFGG